MQKSDELEEEEFEKRWHPHRNITSRQDAAEFLNMFPVHINLLVDLEADICSARTEHPLESDCLEKSRSYIRRLIRDHWSRFLLAHPESYRQDSNFQTLLAAAIETYVVASLHDCIFAAICNHHKNIDQEILERSMDESALGCLSLPDWLLWIPVPSAVVELATLDSRCSPADKATCMAAAIDLVQAEVKGAIADAWSLQEGNGTAQELPLSLNSERLRALLVLLLCKAHPHRLASSLYYCQMMQWAAPTSHQEALWLMQQAVQDLLTRSRRAREPPAADEDANRLGLKRELSLEEVMRVTEQVELKFGRHSSQQLDQREGELSPPTPSDCRMRRLASLLEASSSEVDLHDRSRYWSQQAEDARREAQLKRRSMPNIRDLLGCFKNDAC